MMLKIPNLSSSTMAPAILLSGSAVVSMKSLSSFEGDKCMSEKYTESPICRPHTLS